MADLEALKRCLNPLLLNLQKMELELKCPTCLKLLDLPMALPCSHVFCSHCITVLTKNRCECPSCKLSFLHQDLRPAGHIKSLVNIYKDMNSAVASCYPQQEYKHEIFEKRIGRSVSPLSGNNYVKETPKRGSVHDTAEEKLSDMQLQTSNTKTPGEGEYDDPAQQRSKKHIEILREEAVVDKAEPCSPLSFDSIKDSSCENSDNGNQHRMKRSQLTTNEEKMGNKQTKNHDIGKSKRQKLNGECGIGIQGRTSARDSRTPKLECEDNLKRCFGTSAYSSENRVVECAFCHSFRTTEASGKMLHLLNGKEVDFDQATQPNIIHVHAKCIDWAPQVYFSDDTVKNLEAELSRASKIKCSKCGLKGAALGCYVRSCKKSYHVPCAYETLECRWDCDNYLVLCPSHSSHKLPCDRTKTKLKNKAKPSLDSSGPSSDLTSPVPSEHGNVTSAGWGRDWVFCGSALSKEEKSTLDKLACISEAAITSVWEPNVTHVIASVDENGGCSRTLKFLMAILTGKWILNMEWVKACIKAGHPVPEEPYEVTHDVHGIFDGPNLGRIRAMQKTPKLFYGFSFYITDDFQKPSFRTYLEDLIVTGDGNLLKKNDIMNIQQAILTGNRSLLDKGLVHEEKANGDKISVKVVIVYSSEPPFDGELRDVDEILKQRSEVAEALAADINGRAIRHASLLDNIAACHFE